MGDGRNFKMNKEIYKEQSMKHEKLPIRWRMRREEIKEAFFYSIVRNPFRFSRLSRLPPLPSLPSPLTREG